MFGILIRPSELESGYWRIMKRNKYGKWESVKYYSGYFWDGPLASSQRGSK